MSGRVHRSVSVLLTGTEGGLRYHPAFMRKGWKLPSLQEDDGGRATKDPWECSECHEDR